MKPIYPALFVLFIVGCTSIFGPEGVNLGEEFTLGIGESTTIAHTKITIRLDGIPEDSRCPCFWQGQAVVALEIGGLASTRTDFQLSTYNGWIPTALDTLDYRFKLVSVVPYRVDFELIPTDKYEVTLTIVESPL